MFLTEWKVNCKCTRLHCWVRSDSFANTSLLLWHWPAMFFTNVNQREKKGRSSAKCDFYTLVNMYKLNDIREGRECFWYTVYVLKIWKLNIVIVGTAFTFLSQLPFFFFFQVIIRVQRETDPCHFTSVQRSNTYWESTKEHHFLTPPSSHSEYLLCAK